ncbi:MAG: acetyl-CoA carboxylase biotin carboxylase subunit [Elusimicrobia bacterium HGW-Elusimicrobia-1]|jgi:pyruvate carboxylase subunit A|nr:MAG: acetyl-CoA carboxylase biotin carboxylase subunit [Elusimicrobia bacterium HGW-Elusimicrobia-1]
MFKKILIANRSEIAIRVMRAARELGVKTAAIYSDADEKALHPRYADEAWPLGGSHPKESYLNIKKIIKIAKDSGAEAIHPGYGFLAENPSFAYACEKEKITFIGPSSKVMELMGNKIIARKTVAASGGPVVPGTTGEVRGIKPALKISSEIGYPVIVKAAAGGGGIGMRIARDAGELQEAVEQAKATAGSAFGDPSVFIEKYVADPRHIEIQILADKHGNVVHLGERECSIQRRHQKLIEEAPSPVMTPELRREMGQVAVNIARAINYVNAGTIEFIYTQGRFYFMEMNTRVQVEHPITEMITGVDVVKQQILIAAGEKLPFSQEDVKINGHAIECRINAEDPLNNFAPSPAKLKGYRSPGGIGVRVDSGVFSSYVIPTFYDPMISKLIVWGRTRDEAVERMKRALYEYIIVGPKTNIPFHKAVLANKTFLSGELSTHFIAEQKQILDETMKIIAEEQTLQEKLSSIFRTEARAAAAAVAIKTYLSNR